MVAADSSPWVPRMKNLGCETLEFHALGCELVGFIVSTSVKAYGDEVEADTLFVKMSPA